MRRFLIILGLVQALCALSACGTKGPLYLPKAPPAGTAPATPAQFNNSTAQDPAR